MKETVSLKTKRFVGHGILYIILILLSVIVLFPVLYSILGSFKSTQELMVSTSLIPKTFTFDNYLTAWNEIDYGRYTLNSLICSGCAVLFAVVQTTMNAYVFSRRNFAGKKVLLTTYMAFLFIGAGPAGMFPVYNILVKLGLNKSLLGLIIRYFGAGISNILLCMGYLNGVSKEYDEAARIDGCSFFRTYVQIILPLMAPIAGVIALFAFRGAWNEYLMPMIITTGSPHLQTLPVATVALKSGGQTATMWSVMLAAANISMVPMILVYIICNKQFINGITAGGVKG